MITLSPSATFMIGADPEVFILNSETQRYLSAHNLIPGTKIAPYSTDFGAVQVDGVAAEFNIKPASTLPEFVRGIIGGLEHIDNLVKQVSDDLVVSTVPVVYFDKEYFDGLPDVVKELGCNPDFDAYTGSANYPPHTDECFRTGSGHLHIGWYEEAQFVRSPGEDMAHMVDCMSIVAQLDHSLFLMSGLWDRDTKRRTLYGKKGTFRPKPYGVEYRVLSNAWLSDRRLVGWIYQATQHALVLYEEDMKLGDDPILNQFSALERPLTVQESLTVYTHLVETYEFPELPKDYI